MLVLILLYVFKQKYELVHFEGLKYDLYGQVMHAAVSDMLFPLVGVLSCVLYYRCVLYADEDMVLFLWKDGFKVTKDKALRITKR